MPHSSHTLTHKSKILILLIWHWPKNLEESMTKIQFNFFRCKQTKKCFYFHFLLSEQGLLWLHQKYHIHPLMPKIVYFEYYLNLCNFFTITSIKCCLWNYLKSLEIVINKIKIDMRACVRSLNLWRHSKKLNFQTPLHSCHKIIIQKIVCGIVVPSSSTNPKC